MAFLGGGKWAEDRYLWETQWGQGVKVSLDLVVLLPSAADTELIILIWG
jgi:hypothetical protein